MYKKVVFTLCVMSVGVNAAQEGKIVNSLEERHIIVTGSAVRLVKPNMASWSGSFRVVTDKPELITAQMDQARQQVIKFLEEYKLEPTAVQFQPAQVMPVYDTKANKVERYEANQVFYVRGEDIDKITKIAHESFNLFSKEIQFRSDPVSYDIKDTTLLEQDLLVEALKKARDKAKVLANADNMEIGNPLKIEEVSLSPTRPTYGMMRSSISPSDTDGVFKTISVNIQVTFGEE